MHFKVMRVGEDTNPGPRAVDGVLAVHFQQKCAILKCKL